jgi:hypothetical protein
MQGLTHLDEFPLSLKSLHLGGFNGAISLHFSIRDDLLQISDPATLKSLKRIDYWNVGLGFNHLPEKLGKLVPQQMHDLVTLSFFPPTLRLLDLQRSNEAQNCPEINLLFGKD